MCEKLELIADEIIGYSDGSFHIGWTEEFEALNAEEQEQVREMVDAQISECAHCGWNWAVESLTYHDRIDGHVCHFCYADLDDADEEDLE